MKLVMFDMDGTLTFTDGFAVAENCYVLAIRQTLGLTRVATEWETYTHASSSYCLEAIVRAARGTPPTAAESAAVQSRLVELMEEDAGRGLKTTQIAGSAAALAGLRAAGYAIAIATGDWKLSAAHKLTAAGIPFETIPAAFCDDSHVRTEIMQTSLARAQRHYGCDRFERVVYVGDGAWDVKACRELRWPLVGIGEGVPARRLRALGATQVIPHYEPLATFLAAIERATAPTAAAGAAGA
jgi:phosphoglycolate phosphatase-like HAD superfamily hydrolase